MRSLVASALFTSILSTPVYGFNPQICADTLQPGGIAPIRFSAAEGRVASALNVEADGQIQTRVQIENANGTVETHSLDRIEYRAIQLVGNSVWFLGPDTLREYDLTRKTLSTPYPTLAKPVPVELTTRARGFTYDKGYLYIAHGELGVALFDVRSKQGYAVLRAGVQPGSLAGAVQIQGHTLYVLQGAYHPDGFNGVSVVDLSSGTHKTVAYPPSSGVVDPYSSNMQITDRELLINNSGWIHVYDLATLSSAKGALAPSWKRFFETVDTNGGLRDIYLMINGDLAVTPTEAFACSSLNYIPKGSHRPVTEVRSITWRR